MRKTWITFPRTVDYAHSLQSRETPAEPPILPHVTRDVSADEFDSMCAAEMLLVVKPARLLCDADVDVDADADVVTM